MKPKLTCVECGAVERRVPAKPWPHWRKLNSVARERLEQALKIRNERCSSCIMSYWQGGGLLGRVVVDDFEEDLPDDD